MNLIRNSNMPSDYKGNGCGSGWTATIVPDSLGGIDISEACNIHDYDYEVGGTQEDKERADFNFLINMIIIIQRDDTWYTNEGVALKWAMQYYLAVYRYGYKKFNYCDKITKTE